ncbi:sucrose-6-phosphate hydrolase [Vagococcus teuberi]|uniref:Sucrose-6-phosphate hydrolase n=1 Tax=Vagococcus teuberi TaxID=519472 RepID=A0A1J0A589_9ENTE|nr:sucrose-6-phosphate hydrolase [Vagococcus teuberi]APB31100.1 sucrose-6-phosphate hydrolase [Vagococcus teuberi]
MALKKEWTTPERYRHYNDWETEYIDELVDTVTNSPWRLGFHVQPKTGLLNDPNGFSYFNGKWQLFYQAYPIGPVHGVKSWAHLTSTNLLDWEYQGLALQPDMAFDSHGVYSGSALPVNDKLLLAYTGNVRDENWGRHSYQLGAYLSKDNSIEKFDRPLISEPPKGYTHEFRDPQIIPFHDEYLLVIGGQTKDKEGKALTYSSHDLKHWTLNGELHFTEKSMGFMVECPNLVFSNDKALLIFCPQGLDKSVCHYDNIYPNMYVIGDEYNLENNVITNPSALKNLDEGFDVYATQAFNAPDGRALAISWVGLPEIEYPTDDFGWAHCLSLVKELTIRENVLYQQPAQEYKELRTTQTDFTEIKSINYEAKSARYELVIDFNESTKGLVTLMSDKDGATGLTISFDTTCGKMIIDRSSVGESFASEYGFKREFSISKKPLTLQVFVDESLVEVFVNDGEQVATARVFPKADNTYIHVDSDSQIDATCYNLRQTNQ